MFPPVSLSVIFLSSVCAIKVSPSTILVGDDYRYQENKSDYSSKIFVIEMVPFPENFLAEKGLSFPRIYVGDDSRYREKRICKKMKKRKFREWNPATIRPLPKINLFS